MGTFVRKRRTALTIGVFLCVGMIVWLMYEKKDSIEKSMEQSATSEMMYDTAHLTNSYTNDEYRFSLSMPEGFSAQEFPNEDGGGKTVLIQNNEGEGIQIIITPNASNASRLTADDIRRAIPDMRVSDEQPLPIGEESVGVAFKSNNEAFGGDSRDVWFYFRGNLYQITTYARLDTLLQSIFATWKFF